MKQRRCMRVLTFGVFDYYHYGHLKFFERCKQKGDYLIVAVQKEEKIKKTEPNAQIWFSNAERVEMILANKFVDEAVEFTSVDEDIKNIDFDVLVVGEDQLQADFQRAVEWCKANGREVEYLSRTPGISSTSIKEQLKRRNARCK